MSHHYGKILLWWLAIPLFSSLAFEDNHHRLEKFTLKVDLFRKHKYVLSLRGGYDSNSSRENEIYVKKVLHPRPTFLNFFVALRYASSISLLHSIWLCMKSIGEPYHQTMIELGFHPIQTLSSSTTFSSLDKIFAKQIAINRGDIIPSPYLPGWQALTLSFVSFFFFFASILIPKWFVDLDVLSRFATVESFPSPVRHKTQSNAQEERKSIPSDASVLVHLPESERLHSDHYLSVQRLFCVDENVIPNGKREVSELLYLHPYKHFINLNQRRIYVDIDTGSCFDGGPIGFSDVEKSVTVKKLVSAKFTSGLCTKTKLQIAQERYEKYSLIEIEQYKLWESIIDRISSPLSVMKFIAQFAMLLEEPFWRCAMEFGQTCFTHFRAAKYSISSSSDLTKEVENGEASRRRMKVRALRIDDKTYFNKHKTRSNKCKWKELSASKLLPGDVFYFPDIYDNTSTSTADNGMVVPVDALLLEGNCICSEAALTGESVPQVKTPLEISDDQFDMFGLHRSSVIFAGTKLLHLTSDKRTPKFLALRCGTYSCQGELLRYLVRAKSGRISNEVQDRDTLQLMFFMSIFGIASCMSLFVGVGTRKASSFRTIVQCTRILLASIPSNLPVIISSIVSASSKKLRVDSDTVCSFPSALLDSSLVSMAVFDKTGTLTADTQRLCKTISFEQDKHPLLDSVLSGSHSIVSIGNQRNATRLIGDPLDLACLQYTGAKYNHDDRTVNLPESSTINSSPVKLWIIKFFPFDPTSRKSSSLALALYNDRSVRLLGMVKGAPDAMKSIFSESTESKTFSEWYDDTCLVHTNKGNRLIAMGVKEINIEQFEDLLTFNGSFPNDDSIATLVKKLRKRCKSWNRSLVEQNKEPLNFVGLACFDAFVRKSSLRVVKQLQEGGVRVCMLTGDSLDAGLSSAIDVSIISRQKARKGIIELDIDQNELVYRIKRGKRLIPSKTAKKVTKLRLDKYFKRKCTVVATGKAVEFIIDYNGKRYSFLKQHLNKLSVIGRATPQIKRRFVSYIKQNCNQKVLMCGDGVNDVAALKAADIGVALLNGYGNEHDESDSDIDWEDERRKDKFKAQRNVVEGSALNIPQYRIKKRVMAAMKELERKQYLSENVTFCDFKTLFSSWWVAIKDEAKRSRDIRRGSGRAAQLIQEDEKLRRSLLQKLGTDQNRLMTSEEYGVNLVEETNIIEAGEACLAASFTVLRPSIDGAEAILRSSVATVANVLSTREMIVLESVLACYSLSALYKERVRYGKFMWPTASFLISSVYAASSVASNSPLPKLTKVRPPSKLLCLQVAPSVLLQSIVHLSTLALSVKAAKLSTLKQRNGFHVMRSQICKNSLALTPMLTMGRPPFKPNLVTNVVFLLSAFQSAIIVLVNHQGRPFYGSVLESKILSTSLAALIAFCVACTSEIFLPLNSLLQLSPFPKKLKKTLLLLFITDGLGSYLIKKICTYLWNRELWKAEMRRYHPEIRKSMSAADEEEIYLTKKARENSYHVYIYICAITYCGLYTLM